MTIFRCKMCGGDLEIAEGISFCTCEFCGTKQTIPTVKDEDLQTLFNRANVLRMKSEFDKAAEIYEKILLKNESEAEAYWGLILCKYGIEYVEDPATFKRVPTCHRASYDPVVSDEDYKSALNYADAVQRNIYKQQAAEIDTIQKGILALAQKEDPYDIFICYKETDELGQRTQDSAIANDIYHQLTIEGFKVFYAAITLEDKLGTEYEPYIFSALNTAKVMLSIGTKPEYFNAVWVKNEWSRFLKIMKKDRSKLLIPCYREMDPYELPEEFAHLQAQDMSKIGFINDIVRGIKKVITKDSPKTQSQETVVVQQGGSGTTVNAQIKRGNMALEDCDWDRAESFFEEALNLDPECAEAYLGLYMVEQELPCMLDVQDSYIYDDDDFTHNHYGKRVKQYATGKLAKTLNKWDRLRSARLQREADDKRKKADAERREVEQKKKMAEEDRKKKLEAIRPLQEQLREIAEEELEELEKLNANAKAALEIFQKAKSHEKTEVQEVSKLEELISSKKAELLKMGFLKRKEKKELNTQIENLSENLLKAKNKVSEADARIIQLKNQAEKAEKCIKEYSEKVENGKKKKIWEQIFRILGLDFDGDKVKFGSYENGKEGKKPIEWLVLELSDKGIFLLAKHVIDIREYHGKMDDSTTWETCDLRKWLNSEFLNTAFDERQRVMIAHTKCHTDDNPMYETEGGNDTQDQIFLLSINEVEKYLTSESDIEVELPSNIDRKFDSIVSYNLRWWLRSPGKSSNYAAGVYSDGAIDYDGCVVNYNYRLKSRWDEDYIKMIYDINECVRPALWINLES